MTFRVPNQYRVTTGKFGTTAAIGRNGLFLVPALAPSMLTFKVIASDGGGWEHVSVSLPSRCPTWGEMCFIKGLFWTEDDRVVQFHPPSSEYVNNHPYCLHLWRPVGVEMPAPPASYVGTTGR